MLVLAAAAAGQAKVENPSGDSQPDVPSRSPSPNSKLLALAAQHLAIDSENNEITDRYVDAVRIPGEVLKYQRALSARGHTIAEEMADLTATTIEGLKAKASVLLSYQGHWADGSPLWDNHDELMGWSIARDLLGRTGA